MPLPRLSEEAADRVAVMLATLDADLVDYILDGGRLPDLDALFAQVTNEVEASLTAGIREIDPGGRPSVGQVAEVVGPIRDRAEIAVHRAVRSRNQIPDDPPPQAEDETVDDYSLRVGALIAWAVAAKALSTKRRVALARTRGVSLPKRSAGYGKMRVRTETAVQRNTFAADVVDRNNAGDIFRTSQQPNTGDWVVKVEDARAGPTDKRCEDVNGRYATALWARRHPVEHPNCTRLTRPTRLPSGVRVTLFA